jgi:hypothetical protein|tara:strand:- start:83 stop:484 length:402 start_codon:yes stop_codon:yes gene_type:complete
MSTLNVTNAQVTTLKDGSGNNPSTPAEIHTGRAKVWVNFNGTGTIALRDNFNVSGLTDHETGQYTVTIDNDMSNTNYSVIAGGGMDETSTSNQPLQGANVNNIAVGSFRIHCGSNTYAEDDWEIVTAVVFGDT